MNLLPIYIFLTKNTNYDINRLILEVFELNMLVKK